MRSESPVFIIGEARSGTSILYRTLQKHTSFRPSEPNLGETEIFAHLRRTFMFRKTYPRPLIRFMLDDEDQYVAFLRSIRIPRFVSALNAGLNFLIRDRATWLWFASLNHLVLRSYFFHATIARSCPRLVEKTPTNTPHIAKLSRVFPQARLVYIHRHPVDVFSSYRRRAQVDAKATWATMSVDRFCESYAASVARVLVWLDHGHSNLYMIGYEDFTQDPATEFRALCDFLSEPFESAAVEEQQPDLTRWWGDPNLWGRIVPVTKQWRDFVTVVEADYIQRRLSSTMQAIGQDPYPLPQAASGRR
jgi:hypothetical protein